MKYIQITILASLLFLQNSELAFGQAETALDAFSVKVDGLGCPFCAFGLEKKFKELEGISDIKIEMETGMLTFNYPTEQVLTIDRVEEQVEAAGYTPVTANVTRSYGGIEESTSALSHETKDVAFTEDTATVAGNCGMCKTRIETTALNQPGVKSAEWTVDSQILKVSFDANITSMKEILKTIAAVGHDSEQAKATQEVYDNLHGCCQYGRLK